MAFRWLAHHFQILYFLEFENDERVIETSFKIFIVDFYS